MNKPQSLRHALNKAVPYVRNNPDKLHLFVDNGSLVATGASSMSWEYRYTLNAVIEDFSGDQNLLMAPVLLWLRDNQPDAINNPALREKLFTFEAVSYTHLRVYFASAGSSEITSPKRFVRFSR